MSAPMGPGLPAEAADALRALYAAESALGRSSWRAVPLERRLLDGYMHLLALQGWTLRAIGEPIHVTREWVRQRIVRAEAGQARYDDLPDAPRVPRRPTPIPAPPKRRRLLVKPEVAQQLREMRDACRMVNGSTPADDPRRAISVELSRLLYGLTQQGVSVYTLAQVLGVTHLAVRSRLARHGFCDPCPSMAHTNYKGHAHGESVPA